MVVMVVVVFCVNVVVVVVVLKVRGRCARLFWSVNLEGMIDLNFLCKVG